MNRVGRGYLPLGRVRVLGARVHVHWSAVAVAGVMLGAWHAHPAYAVEVIACYYGVILLHETGHAAMALRLGYRASDIHLSMIHGLCSCDKPDTLRDDALIAWGGVLAQLVVAIPLVALAQVPTLASLSFTAILIAVFGYFSLAMAALNLAPVRGLDGATAWKLLPVLAADFRAAAVAKQATKAMLDKTSGVAQRAPARRRAMQPARAVAGTAPGGPASARWLAAACARLAKAGATWPEIGLGVNPEHDRQVGELVQRIRASHMNTPLQALALIEAACLAASTDDDEARGVDALVAVVGGLGHLEKARW